MYLPSFHRVANCVMQRNDSQCQPKCIWRLFTPPRTTSTDITGNEHPISLFIAADTVSGSINIRLPPIQLHLLHLLGKIHNSFQDAQKDTMKPTSPLSLLSSLLCKHQLSSFLKLRHATKRCKTKKGSSLEGLRGEASLLYWNESDYWARCLIKSYVSLLQFTLGYWGDLQTVYNSDSTIHINACVWFNGGGAKQPEARSRKDGTWNRDYDQFSTYQSPLIGSLSTPEMLSYAGHQS